MRNITRHTGIVSEVTRLNTSRMGNPQYSFSIARHTVRTPVDSVYGYSITNYTGKVITITAGTHYGVLTLNSIEKN